ncbi:trypsin-like peptidase domain-containing protein [Patescibacteria group bacterium]|nr:trypsin-like peptidase domain-containing protein [Patescibacteria group bacterium]
MYEIPQFNFKIDFSKIKNYLKRLPKNRFAWLILWVVILSSFLGFIFGTISSGYFYIHFKDSLEKLGLTIPSIIEKNNQEIKEYIPQASQEQAIINTVKQYSPAVVSIVISKDVPIMEEYYYNPFDGLGPDFQIQIPQYRQKGTEKKEIGGGSGFIISEDGMILTNKHVVLDDAAEYTIFTTDGKKYPAKVLAKDPVQDLAIIKINIGKDTKPFPIVKLGDSDNLQIGQTVIAIGNALGEFRNTVSVGVISGLGRTINASSGANSNFSETLEDIIQTDAAINLGNSGGPLLNLKGEVIGINTAIAESAQNISFTIPINKAKRDIEQVAEGNKITYPFLGIRYVLINEEIKTKNNLPVDCGAWIIKGTKGEVAITKDSAADKAGIKEGDVILELNGEKITQDNSLVKIIMKYSPNDKVSLKILRDKEEKTVEVTLGERTE